MARFITLCLALILTLACAKSAGPKQLGPAPADGPAAAVQANTYHGEGVVKAINPATPAIEIQHGDIEGLMSAMQMEFPVTDKNILNGLAVNDRIDFTIENATDGMKVVAIQKK